ncbi:MAG: type II toxin-antitoxin system VapC family toxin [Candidatus Lokiarchaeota archaeon]|nr:type II toxin-antitoxin system VapC family toxin [Candidatus Lokiarchaeota archaeon]
MVLLDTDILIGFLRNKEDAIKKISELLDKHIIISTTSINAAELYFGASISQKKEENLVVMEKLLSKMKIFSFNLENAKIYGDIRAQLQKTGNLINELDIFIASVAIEQDIKLITRNIKYFERIRKLKYEQW